MTKHVTLAEFQAHAADLLTEVQETGEAVVIEQEGRPVAELRAPPPTFKSLYGAAKGYVTYEGDIISPL